MHVATTDRIPGHRIIEVLGVTQGIVVRAPTISQGFTGSIERVFGGNIQAYQTVCEAARKDAFERMIQNARGLGANAVIGMRFDATEFSPGVTEVLAYGTAVMVVQIAS